MAIYKSKLNPFTGELTIVPEDGLLFFKEGVANYATLPPSGNTANDARITNDDGHMYVWSGTSWVDQGDILDVDWSAITGKPSSTPADIDDAVSKKHTQGTDTTLGIQTQNLDMGGFSIDNVAPSSINFQGGGSITKTDYESAVNHITTTDNPHATTKNQVGLSNVDNTSDIDKPISTTTQTALNTKADKTPSVIDSYTKLLLHFNGTDGATNSVDDSGNSHNPTFLGNAQLDTAEKKFGVSSLQLDGISDYLSFADSIDFNTGANDFTYEFWVKFNSFTSNHTFIAQGSTTQAVNQLLIDSNNTTKGFRFYSTILDVTVQAHYTADLTSDLTTGVWYHYAIVRNGTSLKFFLNGVEKTLTVITAIGTKTLADYNGVMFIGAAVRTPSAPINYLGGKIDEVRFSNGNARWTTNFTPPVTQYTSDPTIAYLNSSGNLQQSSISSYLLEYILNGQLLPNVTKTASNYSILSTDTIIGVTSTASPRTITLPDASLLSPNRIFIIKDESGGASTNNITITPSTGNIDGSSSYIMNTNYGSITVYSDGTNYFII